MNSKKYIYIYIYLKIITFSKLILHMCIDCDISRTFSMNPIINKKALLKLVMLFLIIIHDFINM